MSNYLRTRVTTLLVCPECHMVEVDSKCCSDCLVCEDCCEGFCDGYHGIGAQSVCVSCCDCKRCSYCSSAKGARSGVCEVCVAGWLCCADKCRTCGLCQADCCNCGEG